MAFERRPAVPDFPAAAPPPIECLAHTHAFKYKRTKTMAQKRDHAQT